MLVIRKIEVGEKRGNSLATRIMVQIVKNMDILIQEKTEIAEVWW